MLGSNGEIGFPLPQGGAPPPPPPSLLWALVGEEEEQYVKNWCRDNDHDRQDFFECRLEKADELRQDANSYFKESQYGEALLRYLASIWQLDYDVTQQMELMEHHQLELDNKKLKSISNITAAFLKLAKEAESFENSAPDEETDCIGLWEVAEEGMVVEDPIAIERAAIQEAHARDPDVIDYTRFEEPLEPKKPKVRKKLVPNQRKIEYYRFVKTTADIGLKHISRMGLHDNEIEAKFRYRIGLAEFERGFSEPAFDAFKEANRLLPGDRDIRQAFAKAKAVMQADRQDAKEVWRGKFQEEESPNKGLHQWLIPRQLMGWVKQRVAGGASKDQEL